MKTVKMGVITFVLVFMIFGVGFAQNFEEAQNLCMQGMGLFEKGNLAEALQSLEKANEILKKIPGTEKLQAICHGFIGGIQSQTGKFEESIQNENMALELLKKISGMESLQATCLGFLGVALSNMGRYEEGIKNERLALELYEKMPGTGAQQVDCHKNIGSALGNIGKYDEEIEHQNLALELLKKIPGSEGEQAGCFIKIGVALDRMGRYEEGIKYQNMALEMLKKIKGTEGGQAGCHQNIGIALRNLEKHEESIKHQNLALEMFRKLPGTEEEQAACYKNIGNVLYEENRYEEAIKNQSLALEMFKKIKGTENKQAGCYVNIGVILGDMSKHEEELKCQKMALEIYKKSEGTEREQADCYINIGDVLGDMGKDEEELKYQNMALEIYKKVKGTEREQADCYKNIGVKMENIGKYDEAIKYQNLALEMYGKVKGRESDEAICYANMGDAQRGLKNYDQAIEFYNRALQQIRGWWISLGLARAYEGKGNFQGANSTYVKAIAVSEEKREMALGREARMGVFEEPSQVYSYTARFLVNLAGQKKPLPKSELSAWASSKEPEKAELEAAFHFAEAGKARTTLDLLSERNANLKEKAPAGLLVEDGSLQKQISDLHARELSVMGAQREEIRKKIEELELKRSQIEYEIKKSLIGKYQKPNFKKASEIQKDIPPDTAVLEYVVLPEESILFVLKSDTIQAFRIAVASKLPRDMAGMDEEVANKILPARFDKDKSSIGLEGLIRLYRAPMEKGDLSSPSEVNVKVGKYLADLLIPKEARILLKGVKHLLIVPDGTLSYLPFNALILGSRAGAGTPADYNDCHFLVEDYAVSYVPSLALLDTIRLQAKDRSPGKKLVAFADPVFGPADQKEKGKAVASAANGGIPLEAGMETGELVTRGGFDLSAYYKDSGLALVPLPDTKDEAESIAALFPDYVLVESPSLKSPDKPSVVYAGPAATTEKAKSPDMKSYRYILFSTHGLVDAVNPWLSCIALTGEKQAGEVSPGFLKVEDFLSMDLDADLITLSACQTGLGRVKGGEGMVGFSTALFYAGTSSVCLSLWSVPSRETKEIMVEFYRELASGKSNKAEALQNAQLSLIRKDKKYANPFYWAAFEVIGDYK
ncbi:MAG: CHAT domain-containing tetratricopeptide repeat protein [bacterium]